VSDDLSKYAVDDLLKEIEKRKRAQLDMEYARRSAIIDHVNANLPVFNELLKLLDSKQITDAFKLNPTDKVQFWVCDDRDFYNKYYENDR
jgi:hypothetical protein